MRNWRRATAFSIMAGLALALGAAMACAEPSGTFRFAEQVKLVTMDPQQHTGGGRSYLRPVYETLFERTADDTLVPKLATSYEEDGLNVTLKLLEGVRFSDGTPFNADVVVANLKRSTELGVLSALKPISEVTAVDEYTVRITLNTPAPSLERDLTGTPGMIISPNALDDPALDRNPVGTGPYLYDPDRSREGEVRVYTPNPEYREPGEVGLERLEIWELPDDTARLNALKTGQIDVGLWLSNPQSAIIDRTPGLKLVRNTGGYTYHLSMLDREGTVIPAFADKRVRQAMNYAIDRSAYSQAVDFGLSLPAFQPYPEGSWAHNPALDGRYTYDPDKARDLLEEAGYADGLEFDMPSIPIFQPRLEAVAGFLRDIGITMNIVPVEPGTLARRSRTTDFPATNLVWNSQSDPSYLTNYYISPDASFNPFHAKPSDVLAKLSEDGINTVGAEARAPIYRKMAEELAEESYLIFITSTPLLFGVSEEMTGNSTLKYRPGEDTVYLRGLRVDN